MNVVGEHEPARIYELPGYPEDIDRALRETVNYYHKGLSAYRQCQWDEAMGFFNAALALTPGDKPGQTLLTRCTVYKSDPRVRIGMGHIRWKPRDLPSSLLKNQRS